MMLYGAPVWQPELTKRKIAPLINVQDNIARRVIGAYRTVAGVAARALARIPSADILAKKYHDSYVWVKDARAQMQEEMELPGRISRAICQKADKELLKEWKIQLEEPGKPAAQIREWIHPHLENWINRIDELSFHSTQLLTGHGCFGKYLYRIQKMDTPICEFCNNEVDDARHTLIDCPSWTNDRSAVGWANEGPDYNNLIQWLLKSRENWKNFSKFAEKVMAKKEKHEKERQGQPS